MLKSLARNVTHQGGFGHICCPRLLNLPLARPMSRGKPWKHSETRSLVQSNMPWCCDRWAFWVSSRHRGLPQNGWQVTTAALLCAVWEKCACSIFFIGFVVPCKFSSDAFDQFFVLGSPVWNLKIGVGIYPDGLRKGKQSLYTASEIPVAGAIKVYF